MSEIVTFTLDNYLSFLDKVIIALDDLAAKRDEEIKAEYDAVKYDDELYHFIVNTIKDNLEYEATVMRMNAAIAFFDSLPWYKRVFHSKSYSHVKYEIAVKNGYVPLTTEQIYTKILGVSPETMADTLIKQAKELNAQAYALKKMVSNFKHTGVVCFDEVDSVRYLCDNSYKKIIKEVTEHYERVAASTEATFNIDFNRFNRYSSYIIDRYSK